MTTDALPTPSPGDPSILHTPVLLTEVLEHLAVNPDDRVLDCTCGLGGHSAALLEAGAVVTGVDRDPQARNLAARRLAAHGPRFRSQPGTFAEAAQAAVAAGERYDGVLADLGVSSMQLDDGARGFGIRSDADADMRMGDGTLGGALELIDASSEADLATIIREYGEERHAGRVARWLKAARARGERSASGLAAAVRAAVPGRHQRHPALRTFQALRIAVNHELEELAALLRLLPDLLTAGGRAVIISFHSLEDRQVKTAFRDLRKSGVFADAARRVVIATDQEISANPRAASAKLRWARRAGPDHPQPRNHP